MRKRLVCLLLTLCMLFPLMAAGEETAEKTENGEMEQFLQEETPTNSQKIYIWKMFVATTNPNMEKLNNDKNA